MAEQDRPEESAPRRGRIEHADLASVPHQRSPLDDGGDGDE